VRSAIGAVRGVMIVCAESTRRSSRRDHVRPPRVWSGLVASDASHAVFDVVHADDRARCELALIEAVRLGAPTEADARLRQADGAFRWHRLDFSLDDNGERWYATAIDDHDACDLERSPDDDERVDPHLRDQLLASVAHELRVPITTVLLWENVLRGSADDIEVRARALDAIHESATTQARLVDDLLDVSRAINGKLAVDLHPLDIGAVLAAAIDDEGPSSRANQHRIERDIERDLGQVFGDVARLRQVLRNLLSNAIKFTEERGTIRVSGRREGRRVIIEIADSGRGIAREFLTRIFEPFSQADDTWPLARSHTGLGLGLAISYQLVMAHGGQLSASSPGVGRGSTFSVILPVIDAELAPPPPRLATRLSGMRLLVVDDDRRVLDALQVLLQCAGATVDVADSVDTGFSALQRATPDLVLSDLAMPEEDGYSFVQRIRKLSGAVGGVPAVAVTGHTTTLDRERALAAGFDLYVTKPVDVDHLISTIAELVDAKRASTAV
jgi:signal transduction histidine kinase/ActR/RegA family two-component response regulator